MAIKDTLTRALFYSNKEAWLSLFRYVWSPENHGHESGLDADLLDAQHGSFYQNVDNVNAGTLALEHGGTGASTADDARTSLGIPGLLNWTQEVPLDGLSTYTLSLDRTSILGISFVDISHTGSSDNALTLSFAHDETLVVPDVMRTQFRPEPGIERMRFQTDLVEIASIPGAETFNGSLLVHGLGSSTRPALQGSGALVDGVRSHLLSGFLRGSANTISVGLSGGGTFTPSSYIHLSGVKW